MPHPDDFSAAALDAVVDDLGARLPRVLGRRQPPATAATVTASLQVWALTPERLRASPAVDLAGVAEPAGQWHHQVAVDGEPELYARSTSLDPGAPTPQVHEIVRSTVAGRLDAAIDVAERSASPDALARLLEADAYHVWALWLLGGQGRGEVVVVEAPPDLGIVRDQLVTDRELVRRLRPLAPIVGVRPS